MKTLLTFIILLTTPLAALLAQNPISEELVIPLSDPGKPGALEVGVINGSIKVMTHSGKDVLIEATSGTRAATKGEGGKEKIKEKVKGDNAAASEAQSSGMRRITPNNGLELTAEERNNRVKVSTNSHAKAVDLTIRVPERFSLKLSSVNGGAISVENVKGELEVDNMNGPIELTNVGGSAVANTLNGSIKATFTNVNANTPMAFSTLNGRIDVTFPANMKANVKMKSDRGEIYSDFDMDIDKSQPQATRSSQSGVYRVTVENWVSGKINGGGPEIMMKSMQGNIYVRKAGVR